jgi:hypothetical protein
MTHPLRWLVGQNYRLQTATVRLIHGHFAAKITAILQQNTTAIL